MNKFIALLCGIVFIAGSIRVYMTKKFTFHYYEPLYLGDYAIIVSMVFFIVGLLSLYNFLSMVNNKK